MKREWRSSSHNNSYYYFRVYDGLIVGQAYNLSHTMIWAAKILISANEELILGQYVEMEFAKKAIEEYWGEKDRTLEVPHEHLLSTL
jgi:hypothetical protein